MYPFVLVEFGTLKIRISKMLLRQLHEFKEDLHKLEHRIHSDGCWCSLGIQNDLHLAIVLCVFRTKLKCL